MKKTILPTTIGVIEEGEEFDPVKAPKGIHFIKAGEAAGIEEEMAEETPVEADPTEELVLTDEDAAK